MASKYDQAITIFSPSGNLFQVEYAMQAVNRGLNAVAVRTKDAIILAIQKKSVTALQDPRTVRKVLRLDNNMVMAFAGLNADARILGNQARLECQNYRLMYSDDPPVGHIARFIASIQQKHTQRGGVRPVGASIMIAGYDTDKKPRLYLTEPSG